MHTQIQGILCSLCYDPPWSYLQKVRFFFWLGLYALKLIAWNVRSTYLDMRRSSSGNLFNKTSPANEIMRILFGIKAVDCFYSCFFFLFDSSKCWITINSHSHIESRNSDTYRTSLYLVSHWVARKRWWSQQKSPRICVIWICFVENSVIAGIVYVPADSWNGKSDDKSEIFFFDNFRNRK